MSTFDEGKVRQEVESHQVSGLLRKGTKGVRGMAGRRSTRKNYSELTP